MVYVTDGKEVEDLLWEQFEFLMHHHREVHANWITDCRECARWGQLNHILMEVWNENIFSVPRRLILKAQSDG